MELICSNEFDREVDPLLIPAPNSCFLLCDYSQVLTVYSGWESEDSARKVWWYRLAGEQEASIVPEQDMENFLYCWA